MEVGGYCEDFIVTQDLDLWFRIAEKFDIEILQEELRIKIEENECIHIKQWELQQEPEKDSTKSQHYVPELGESAECVFLK